MSQLLPPGSENWLPLVALLWLASVFLLVVSSRRYFASRALNRAEAESTTMPQPPFIKALATPQLFGRRAYADAGDSEPILPAPIDPAPPAASMADQATHSSTNATQATAVASTIARAPESGATSVREAVRARVARDRASAQGLSDLIRALYLDQSTFTFHTIAELQTEDRALAKALVEAWLAEPSAVDAWKEIYDIVREVSPSSVV